MNFSNVYARDTCQVSSIHFTSPFYRFEIVLRLRTRERINSIRAFVFLALPRRRGRGEGRGSSINTRELRAERDKTGGWTGEEKREKRIEGASAVRICWFTDRARVYIIILDAGYTYLYKEGAV